MTIQSQTLGHIISTCMMIKQHTSIVHRCIAVLGSNVTNDDAFQWLVVLHISHLDNERMGPMSVILDHPPWCCRPWQKQLRNNNCMIGSSAERAISPLAGRQSRAVQNELLCLRVPFSLQLHSSHIATVTHLRLSICTDDLPSSVTRKPVGLLGILPVPSRSV